MSHDQRIGAFFLGLCLFAWVYVIPRGIAGEVQALYPRLTVLFIAVPALLLLLRKDRHKREVPPQEPKALLALAGVAALYLAYLFSVSLLGFYSSSILFGAAFMLIFGSRGILAAVGIPLGLSALVYAVIEHFLRFPLPGGVLF